MTKKTLRYAGIGPREIPEPVSDRIVKIAAFLKRNGCLCETGGARGADQAFKKGAEDQVRIWTSMDTTEASKVIAAAFHPAWDNCSIFAKKLLGRNPYILLGPDLQSPVDFVITWTITPLRGGTSMGLRIAKRYGIPVCNLAFMRPDQVRGFLKRMIE